MSAPKTIVIDLPTLRLDWIEAHMPRLNALTKAWHRGAIEPVFPALTCPSQASLTTGLTPEKHGIIANGLYDRTTRLPEFWTFPDDRVEGKRIWGKYSEAGAKTGAFFLLNIRDAHADVAILPKPIHKDDGSMEMWCWHKPEGIYPRLVKKMGHFNLLFFWGPMAGIASSRWIAQAAAEVIRDQDLDLSFVYLPHTDYAPQKFGPESEAYKKAHSELDSVIADLLESLAERWPQLRVVIVSEYAITGVEHAVFPNRLLREAGLFTVETRQDREYPDYPNTPALALADHQICHVYCNSAKADAVASVFAGLNGIDEIITDPARRGLGHPNSGDVLLVASPDAWFAYPWWEDFAQAPEFANKMDIHNKPGYDPLEMFWDPKINGTSQDATLVRGSHGAFSGLKNQMAAVLTNITNGDKIRRTTDVAGLLQDHGVPRTCS